jgi:Fur family zinc uptake transcriptional regulator
MSCSHIRQSAAERDTVIAALHAAEARCVAAGERWTRPRHRTYELLLEADGPVKAYDLISAYGGKGEQLAKPPTVYRALEFLSAHGLVHRIDSLNAFLACRSDHRTRAAEFLICDCCGRVQELALGAGPVATDAAAAHGFRPERVVLEIHGACAACS